MTDTLPPAGRELDALVAVEVMGWRPRGVWRWVPPDVKPHDYSTTGDGMLAVLERMRELGWEWSQESDHGKFRACFDRMSLAGFVAEAALADTLPEAICHAALLAVRAG